MKDKTLRKIEIVGAKNNNSRKAIRCGENGSAIVIALLIMILLMAFVALAISRTTSETVSTGNDAAETRAFEAAHASLEIMTQNFDKIFDVKLNPDQTDLTRIEGQEPPDFEDDYEFSQNIEQSQAPRQVIMTGEPFQGLNATRDEWRIDTIAEDRSTGVKVALRRRFFNNRIPIFQFGIFYDDDLEFHPGPRFNFGGRVHSNGSLFMMAQDGLYFSSKVTADEHIFTDVARNGMASTKWGENVWVKNASGTFVQLKANMGSVLTNPANGTPKTDNPEYPKTYENSQWKTNEDLFQGNLLADQPELNLPIKINARNNGNNVDYVEIIKRGKEVGDLYNDGTTTVPVTSDTADDQITAKERYYNKTGIRVSLADAKAKLPGCAAGTGTTAVLGDCGVRLDGKSDGLGGNPNAGEARGYEPRPMTDGYQATRVNGERFYVGREMWIKIETIGFNATTNAFDTVDITQDILSLGVTDAAAVKKSDGTILFNLKNHGNKDSRSVVKLQRFVFGGAKLVNSGTNDKYITNSTLDGVDYNYVLAAEKATTDPSPIPVDNASYNNFNGDHADHRKEVYINDSSTKTRWVVPFPIKMFDTREGLYYEDKSPWSVFNPTAAANYGKNVPWNGVMSMVEIDVGNLKDFLDGSHDTRMPNGTPFAVAKGRALKSADIPQSNGWVFYVSDRRGDHDFDGEYDMEDIYGNNDGGNPQPGEDINNNGKLDADYFNEAVKYRGFGSNESPDIAAVLEHKFYRRGVRLVNGKVLPGKFDKNAPTETKGFTVASENGVYVFGNYNATGISNIGTPTKAIDYLPQDTLDHIPASIAADAVTILSNRWSDARSFASPFALSSRSAGETTVRFAMLAGDARSSLDGTPNQGGGDPRLTGGVHNFKRFLENWSGNRLNYAGSLINLYNARNNNGAFKCCAMVYSPPTRNWVFDSTFLDPNRLPPGTPFFQSIQLTGFQRLN